MLTRQSLQWWMQRHDLRLSPEAIGDLLGLANEPYVPPAAVRALPPLRLDRAGA